MNCNVHVFCKMIFSNKFGSILETDFSYYIYKVTLIKPISNKIERAYALICSEFFNFKSDSFITQKSKKRGTKAASSRVEKQSPNL